MEKTVEIRIEEQVPISEVQTHLAEQVQPGNSYTRRQTIVTMMGLLLALFFASLDQNIVGTAMPRIIGEFHGFDRFTWVATSFMLTATVMIPIYGKLSDLFGRKIIFLTCLSLFLLGSALCGMAQTMDQLILFRAFQGLGAGGIMPIAMIAFADLLSPEQRAKWQGAMMGIFTFASILGPIIGGWITDHLSWRWAFYVNLPFGLLALAALLVLMPALRPGSGKPRIDFLGAILLIVGVVPILLGFSCAGSLYPWLSWQILSMLGGGLTLLVLLCLYEVRLARSGGEPIIDPGLFKNRTFTVSVLSMMITFMGMMGGMAFLPLYVQGVLHMSATNSGFLMAPMMIAMVISSVLVGQIASRTGRYRLCAISGMGLIVFGMALLLRLDLSSSYIDVIVAMVLIGLGIGTSMMLYGTIIMNALPKEKLGQAISNMDFFQEMGGPIALSVLGPILASQYIPTYHTALPTTIKQTIPQQLLSMLDKPDALLNPTALKPLTEQFTPFGREALNQVLAAVRVGLMQGIHMAFLIGFFIILIGFVIVLCMPKIKIQKSLEEQS